MLNLDHKTTKLCVEHMKKIFILKLPFTYNSSVIRNKNPSLLKKRGKWE